MAESILDEACRRFDDCKGSHGAFVRHYERGERAYRGVLSAVADAAKWRHKYHPPYAFNLIETVVANTVEEGLRLTARPAPMPGMSQHEAQQLLAETATIEDLLQHEWREDDMGEKQRPFFLTAAIGGRGVLKTCWDYRTGPVRRQKMGLAEHDDGYGGSIAVPVIQEEETLSVIRDRSYTEVVDPRDFIVHESARALDPHEPGGAQYLFHRCWYSYEQLKMFAASGFFNKKAVERLKETRDFSEGEHYDRAKEVFQANTRKGLIEVLEYWKLEDGIVKRAYVGNRAVVLREQEDNPFWHDGYPFNIGSSMPQPFSTIGMSEIELIADVQEMLWEISNQRLDNTELVNNALFLIRSDVMDPDAFEYYPGARWMVEDVNQVKEMETDQRLITSTLEIESVLKGDLQNLTNAAPFASGADTQTVDNKTATGASIVMNAAQQALKAKKYQSQLALAKEAQMRLSLCQQFIGDEYLLHASGKSGAQNFKTISALDIQGSFKFVLRAMGESDMRQERRAEANQVLQQMQQLYPTAYMAGHPIDMQQVMLWWARMWDMEDEITAFFASDEQKPDPEMVGYLTGNAPKVSIRANTSPNAADTALQQTGFMGQQQPGQAPAQPGQPNLGVTAASAVDASQPSATGGMSMSPQMMLQRALAMGGGSQNAGRN